MEVDTCRERLSKYCRGNGLDLGFGGSPILRSAICVDRPENDGERAHKDDPFPTHLVGDASNLYWFKDGVLDYVFSSHCLEDFVDTDAVLKEWLRVIKPNGFLVLFLPDEQVYRSITPDHIRNMAHKHPDFSLQTVKKALYSIGYGESTIVHELWPVPNNQYSFDLVVQKPAVAVPEATPAPAVAPPPVLAAPPPVKVIRALNAASFENKKLIQLGRYGDIVNILPIARDISERIGRPVPIICQKDYADILDGVSYAMPEYMPVEDFKPESANGFNLLNAYATHPTSEKKIAHNLQSWEQVGYLERWGDLFPVFDRRCSIRETALAESHVHFDRAVMLVSLTSVSSPLTPKTKEVIWQLIRESFGHCFQIIDVGAIKAHRPYDLLGLIDLASVVITVDTLLLHLCTATNVPVVALLSNHAPTFWRASAVKGNIVYSARCDKVVGSWTQIVRSIMAGHRPLYTPKIPICHVVPLPRHPVGEDARRLAAAQESWKPFHAQGAQFLPFDQDRIFTCDASLTLPYLKDALKAALAATSGSDSIICFTNADIILTPGFYGAIQQRMVHSSFCCSFRMEFDKVEPGQGRGGTRSHGRDMFAFKRSWLAANLDQIPDFLIGMGGWDYALCMWFRILSGRSPEACDPSIGMPDIEMEYGFVWHEKHAANWRENAQRYAKAYQYNRVCLEAFLNRLGLKNAHRDIL